MSTVPPPPLPLFDLFLDLPHPAASSTSAHPPALRVSAPHGLSPELEQNIPQISRFAFPEYQVPEPQQQQAQAQQPPYNRRDTYALQNAPFTSFTFALQLGDGSRLHGHVRRYLPARLPRYDVGRRGERAAVILTRSTGANLVYAGLLKSVEAIAALQASAVGPYKKEAQPTPQEMFLHQVYNHHQHLAKIYASKPPQERGKPLVCSIPALELGPIQMYGKVDTMRFIMPPSLLQRPITSVTTDSSLLPLLRCVGIVHALRILAALLSERRVIMVSTSPTRLASCSHSALSMLAQGLLHWQHLYVPVLPPHLQPYLAAPYPYLIGVLQAHAGLLDATDGLGEVLVIYLDNNQLETRGMPADVVASRLPDLFDSMDMKQATSGGAASNAELLAQDVAELLKTDKKILYGESTLQQMGETAAKASKAVKKTFFKLRDKGRDLLNKGKDGGSGSGLSSTGTVNSEAETATGADEADPDAKPSTPDYIYTESCHNEVSEEEARIAFASFFLCIFGDMRWYLNTPGQGQPPRLDRSRLLQQKRQVGEGEGTPMWPLLQNFCQSQMLEEFAKARVEEVARRLPILPDAPLFLRCAQVHRQQHLDFGVLQVRRVARQVATQSQPLVSSARRTAMTLTSNKNFEGDYGQAVAQLVEQCRECSSVLFDVMSVLWLRMRDCRGLQWKHAYQALQILRNLLYHGPLAAIAEATDGLAKIRALKFYENMRNNVADQVRVAANQIYELLVDRTKLFSIRRACAERRRVLQGPQPRLPRDSRLRVNSPFKSVHAAMNPNATTGTVVQIPPAPPAPAAPVAGAPQYYNNPAAAAAQPQAPAAPQAPGINQDLLGLFGDVSVSGNNSGGAAANPFAAASVAPGSAPTSGGVVPQQQQPPLVAQVNNPFGAAVAPQQQQQQQHINPYGQQQPHQQQAHLTAPVGATGQPPVAGQVPPAFARPAASQQYQQQPPNYNKQ